jgi:hypothetical protein
MNLRTEFGLSIHKKYLEGNFGVFFILNYETWPYISRCNYNIQKFDYFYKYDIVYIVFTPLSTHGSFKAPLPKLGPSASEGGNCSLIERKSG